MRPAVLPLLFFACGRWAWSFLVCDCSAIYAFVRETVDQFRALQDWEGEGFLPVAVSVRAACFVVPKCHSPLPRTPWQRNCSIPVG